MKNILLCAGLFIASTITCLGAFPFSPHLDGTMMPYDFTSTDTVKPWGDDYKPVFVNYVARHGARYLSSAKKTEHLRKVLEEALSSGSITEKGKDFLKLLNTVDSVTDGQWGALNPIGIQEEQQLGNELTATLPELLKEGHVLAESTYVPRVVMTMYEVCHSLADYSNNLEITTMEGKSLNPLLRYFTTDKEYVNYIDQGPWRYAYDTFAEETLPLKPAACMINAVIDSKELQKITSDAYGVLQSLAAAGIESDPSEWFTEEEYANCWKVDNLKHYYQRSVSTFSPLPAESATPLLKRIVTNADKAFSDETGDLKGELLFGHAETLIPLFARMQLPGCYAPDAMPDHVASDWKDWEVSPLGANLMMVCLKDNDGNDFVSLRLNGRWIDIAGNKVIPWQTLKSYWNL